MTREMYNESSLFATFLKSSLKPTNASLSVVLDNLPYTPSVSPKSRDKVTENGGQ